MFLAGTVYYPYTAHPTTPTTSTPPPTSSTPPPPLTPSPTTPMHTLCTAKHTHYSPSIGSHAVQHNLGRPDILVGVGKGCGVGRVCGLLGFVGY